MDEAWQEWLVRSWRRGHVAPWRLAAALVFAGLAAWLALATRRGLAAARLGRRARRGRSGEGTAVALLAAAGFRILARQARRTLTVEVDGAPLAYDVQVDFVVEDRRGRRFAAEVKTGAQAPDPLYGPTRRQLLEYQLGYAELSGVLLVDVEAGAVRAVRFPFS